MSRPMLRPSPEALAADPPPFRCLGVLDGFYLVEHNVRDRVGAVTRYHPTRMTSPHTIPFQHSWKYATPWLTRHFPKPRRIEWPDGRIDPIDPDVAWGDFSVWLRDACEAVEGALPKTAATTAAIQPSPSAAPAVHTPPSYAQSRLPEDRAESEMQDRPFLDVSAIPRSSSRPLSSRPPGSAPPLSHHSAPGSSRPPLVSGPDDREAASPATQASGGPSGLEGDAP